MADNSSATTEKNPTSVAKPIDAQRAPRGVYIGHHKRSDIWIESGEELHLIDDLDQNLSLLHKDVNFIANFEPGLLQELFAGNDGNSLPQLSGQDALQLTQFGTAPTESCLARNWRSR